MRPRSDSLRHQTIFGTEDSSKEGACASALDKPDPSPPPALLSPRPRGVQAAQTWAHRVPLAKDIGARPVVALRGFVRGRLDAVEGVVSLPLATGLVMM